MRFVKPAETGIRKRVHLRTRRVSWTSPSVQAVLRRYEEGEFETLGSVKLAIEKITGATCSISTLSRQVRKPPEEVQEGRSSWNIEGGLVSGAVEGSDGEKNLSDDDEVTPGSSSADSKAGLAIESSGRNDPKIHRRRMGAYKRGDYRFFISRKLQHNSLVVYEGNGFARLYRCSKDRGSKLYYRCSRCDTLRHKTGNGPLANLSVEDGQLAGNPFPQHNPDCKPLTHAAIEALGLDREARARIAEGSMEPRDAWQEAHRKAVSLAATPTLHEVSELLPEWRKCRTNYKKMRTRAVAHPERPPENPSDISLRPSSPLDFDDPPDEDSAKMESINHEGTYAPAPPEDRSSSHRLGSPGVKKKKKETWRRVPPAVRENFRMIVASEVARQLRPFIRDVIREEVQDAMRIITGELTTIVRDAVGPMLADVLDHLPQQSYPVQSPYRIPGSSLQPGRRILMTPRNGMPVLEEQRRRMLVVGDHESIDVVA